MTKSELMLYAVAEARKMTGISWREAMRFGLRRAHNKNETELFVAARLAEWTMPKFMWLRGM